MKIFVLLGILLLTACSGPSVGKIEIKRKAVDRPELVLQDVDSYTARPINWTSVESKNKVLFCVVPKDYENYLITRREILKIVNQQRIIIKGYKDFYSKNDKPIPKAKN